MRNSERKEEDIHAYALDLHACKSKVPVYSDAYAYE